MLDYLLCASILIYQNQKNLSVHDTGIPSYFAHFLKSDVFPKAKGMTWVKNDQIHSWNGIKKNWYGEMLKTFGDSMDSLYKNSASRYLCVHLIHSYHLILEIKKHY